MQKSLIFHFFHFFLESGQYYRFFRSSGKSAHNVPQSRKTQYKPHHSSPVFVSSDFIWGRKHWGWERNGKREFFQKNGLASHKSHIFSKIYFPISNCSKILPVFLSSGFFKTFKRTGFFFEYTKNEVFNHSNRMSWNIEKIWMWNINVCYLYKESQNVEFIWSLE